MGKRKTRKTVGSDEEPLLGIVETKLLPSHSTSTLLERDRLGLVLEEALSTARLVLVSAPAGAGKSSLVSLWGARLSNQGFPTAWINLDTDDREPVRLITCIAAAIYRACPSGPHRAGAILMANPQPSARQVLSALIADLSSIETRMVLFLEDYHLVSGNETDDLVSQLIQQTPDKLLLVLTTRERPDLPLADMRIQGQLVEIGSGDLAFRLDEVQTMMAGRKEIALSEQTVRLLCEKTEGWIAGIQLFFLAVRGGADTTELLAGFSGTDRDVTDYLAETVLHQQPAQVREFLLQSALLDRMCAELCEAITDNARASAMLEELERRNLFIISLDRNRQWYRYHHLFGEFLRSRIEIIDPDRMRSTLLTAMQWSSRQGYIREAITYALRAGDYESASQMIVDIAADLVQHHGAHSTLLHWIKRLPPEALSFRPLMRIYYAWSLTFTHRHFEALEQLEMLETECAEGASEAGAMCAEDSGYIEESADMIRAVIAGLKGQYVSCQKLSTALLEQSPDTMSFNVGTVANALGYSCIGTFDFAAGRAAVQRAIAAFQACGAEYGEAWARAIEGMLAYGEGNITRARKVHGDALAHAENTPQDGSHTSGIHSVLLARILYEANALDASSECLNDGFYCIAEIGSPEFTFAGYSVLSRLNFLAGSLDAALAALDQAGKLVSQHGLVQMIPVFAAEKVALLLRAGERQEAMRIARQSGLLGAVSRRGNADAAQADEAQKLTRARLHLAAAEPEEARRILSTLIRSARNPHRGGLLITSLILNAVALGALNRERACLRALQEALQLAAPHNQIRRFADEDPAIVEPLKTCLSMGPDVFGSSAGSREYPRSLARACRFSFDDIAQNAARADRPSEERPVERMTAREIELLRLVEKGYSNREIAGELFISEKTAKWHLHNAFSKLGVKNRSGAVALARSLDLL